MERLNFNKVENSHRVLRSLEGKKITLYDLKNMLSDLNYANKTFAIAMNSGKMAGLFLVNNNGRLDLTTTLLMRSNPICWIPYKEVKDFLCRVEDSTVYRFDEYYAAYKIFGHIDDRFKEILPV
jgi:hypothetical protein